MAYNAKRRNIIGTIGFFVLGVLIGGIASMIAVIREWVQYKANGMLEHGDLWRYVIVSSAGAIVQLVIILQFLLRHFL